AILVRSGIGPGGEIADLPVGKDMQDHAMLVVHLPQTAEFAAASPDERHTNCCVRFDSGDPDGSPLDMMLVALDQNVLAMEYANVAAGAGAIGVWLNATYSRGSV